MSGTIGKPIRVGDALSRSVDLIRKRPELMVPQGIVLVLSLLIAALGAATLSPLRLVLSLASEVVWIIVAGAYPSMVQAALGGGQFSVSDSLRKAYNRFWTLFVAGLLVALIVVLGFIALIVPGIIFVTWYAYTVPAIMLEDKGATAGMAASKAFGRDKKWSTFTIGLVLGVVALVVYGIVAATTVASPVVGQVVSAFVSVPLDAWIAVVLTYTYITYGPSSVPARMEVPGYGVVPPSVRATIPSPSSSAIDCISAEELLQVLWVAHSSQARGSAAPAGASCSGSPQRGVQVAPWT